MKPNDYPEILYKYRNWRDQFQKDVLEKNHLFMTSPSYFNDPFDCRISKNFLSLDTPEKIQEYADAFINRQEMSLVQMGKNLKFENQSLVNDLTNDLEGFHKGSEQYFFEQKNLRYGILSMSKRWDSTVMWSHYADYHKGVCYGFWEEKLRESALFGKGGPVHYNADNNYPSINPIEDRTMEQGFVETHTKAYDWRYEEEYRLFNLFFPEIPSDEDRIKKVPNDFFAEIILGIAIPEIHKHEILEIAKDKKIKVYQAKKVLQKFEIIREQIL
jgi:hypothetical protein